MNYTAAKCWQLKYVENMIYKTAGSVHVGSCSLSVHSVWSVFWFSELLPMKLQWINSQNFPLVNLYQANVLPVISNVPVCESSNVPVVLMCCVRECAWKCGWIRKRVMCVCERGREECGSWQNLNHWFVKGYFWSQEFGSQHTAILNTKTLNCMHRMHLSCI